MYVVASVAVSLDGCIDDAGPERLVLSGAADLDRVDALRAGVDAILVGAGTVRADDPRLRVRSPQRRAQRRARGLPETPLRVVLGGRGEIDPAARVLIRDDGPALVYVHPGRGGSLARTATVVELADATPDAVLADLAARGVARLLVEGGTAVHTAFLAAGAVDELHVAVAPLLVGDAAAPRFVHPAAFPPGRLTLVGVDAVGDMAVLRYGARDHGRPDAGA